MWRVCRYGICKEKGQLDLNKLASAIPKGFLETEIVVNSTVLNKNDFPLAETL